MSDNACYQQLSRVRGKLLSVTTFRIIDFESVVRDYLADKKKWDDVHSFVIESEVRGETDFPLGTPAAMEDLYFAFLADANDDRQFLRSKSELREMLKGLEGSTEQ
jgi:hypothetical protein